MHDFIIVGAGSASSAAGVGGPGAEMAEPAHGGGPVAAGAQRAWRDQPLRGRRLRPGQRGGGLPEPDVPLPAHRDSLRRVGAGRPARISGPHRADEFRRPRAGTHYLSRPDPARPGPARPGIGLSGSITCPPRRTGGNGCRPFAWCGIFSISRPFGRSTRVSWPPARTYRPTSRFSAGWPATRRLRCIPRAPAGWAWTTWRGRPV